MLQVSRCLCLTVVMANSHNLERGKKMNIYTRMIGEIAQCTIDEARELQDIIENEWIIEHWSRATERQLKSAVRTAQARKAS
jgi:hypothetical protein